MTTARITPLSAADAAALIEGKGEQKHAEFKHAGNVLSNYIVPISPNSLIVNTRVGESVESSLVELIEG